jgi:uncharacterized membrane protein
VRPSANQVDSPSTETQVTSEQGYNAEELAITLRIILAITLVYSSFYVYAYLVKTNLLTRIVQFFEDALLRVTSPESATVIKLNIALNSDWGYNGVIPAITEIATCSGDLSERGELSKLLSETSLALLRRSNDFIAISHESKSFEVSDSENTESYFQRIAIKERSKFERENSPAMVMIDNGSKSSLAVVSLVVALRGSQNPAYKSARSLTDAREMLQSLAADAMTDGGKNVLAVELLWTPDSPNTVITDRDLIMDYPELVKLA